jgi:hypothetical protein
MVTPTREPTPIPHALGNVLNKAARSSGEISPLPPRGAQGPVEMTTGFLRRLPRESKQPGLEGKKPVEEGPIPFEALA